MTERDLLERAARAAEFEYIEYVREHWPTTSGLLYRNPNGRLFVWNPIKDDGARYRLAKKLGISIDFRDCCVWKRLSNGELIQEFWGGDSGDEAHAIVRAAALLAAPSGRD